MANHTWGVSDERLADFIDQSVAEYVGVPYFGLISVSRIAQELQATREDLSAVTAERDRAKGLLQEIENWCNAYPLDVFPEPDFKVVRELLSRGGITVDSVSASNFRHVLKGVAEIAHRNTEAPHD